MRKTLFLVVLSIVIVWSFSSVPSCPTDEAELSSKRVQTLITYGSVVRAAQSATSTIPFNLDYFISQLASVFTPDATFSVPSGVGVYAGLNDVAEYLALQHGQKECHIPHAPQLGSVTQARLAALGSSPGRGQPTERAPNHCLGCSLLEPQPPPQSHHPGSGNSLGQHAAFLPRVLQRERVPID